MLWLLVFAQLILDIVIDDYAAVVVVVVVVCIKNFDHCIYEICYMLHKVAHIIIL